MGIPKESIGIPKESMGIPKESIGIPKESIGIPKESLYRDSLRILRGSVLQFRMQASTAIAQQALGALGDLDLAW